MVEGRSKKVFKAWLAARPSAWRDRVETVAMDGFTEFKTAAAEEVPHAATVMDPFHVVKLASLALDTCSQRIQQATLGHRGRRGGPLYQARRTLLTGAEFLTQRQTQRLEALFADDQHRDVHRVCGISTRGSSAPTGTPTRPPGRCLIQLIKDLTTHTTRLPDEARKLGRTLKRRAEDILGYFDRPGTSNGPTETLNGRLEHLRGSALGFRNPTHYIARSLLETGGFRPRLHPQIG